MHKKKILLMILDGWGHGDKSKSDVIFNSKTPFVDSLYSKFPNCELLTDSENVGLPENQMGNSEVGHLNIGAGRIVLQDLAKINYACEKNLFKNKENLLKSFDYAKKNDAPLHLIGLVSDGGIHSHQDHLYKLCESAREFGVKDVFIHAFTDGRDCDPKSAIKLIKKLEKNLFGAKIATVCGRYYAMDRDQRWERIKFSYDAMVHSIGVKSHDCTQLMAASYDQGITDEFIKPIVVVDDLGMPIAKIKNNDAVICFNFRTDRCRQITNVLTQKDMNEFKMQRLDLHFTTMTNYDSNFNNINVIFEKKNIKNTLGEVLEYNNLTQTRIAETEKYPHVTYFFSGGREKLFEGERRLMVDSPKVSTYDLKPEMSAKELTNCVIDEIEHNTPNFICLNYANVDMVGHTGVYSSINKAIECIDYYAEKVVHSAIKNNYIVMIIADHGNADFAINSDGSPNTAHTKNPVPCFLINSKYKKISDGILADIAPTILNIMGCEKPKEMSGKTLIK